MTALSASAPTGIVVPAQRTTTPRAAAPQIPAQRRPVDHVPAVPGQRPGRHRVAAPAHSRRADAVTVAARVGSVVTLAAMLVAAAATAGLTDGVAPSGAAAEVASATLR